MDLDEARQFLAANHRCVLITRKHDGSPQPSPVVHALDAAGHVVVSTRSRSVKVRNLQRDPRVTLCVLPDTFFGKWIVVDGSARIVGLPDAMDGLVDLYRQVAGEHPDWDDFRAAMVREERVLVTVSVERVGPDGTA